jgi:hypothetical protein
MKNIDKKILEELTRHNSINKYITEQEVEVGAEVGAEATPEEVPTEDPMLEPADTTPEVIDVTQDDEVEKIGDDGSSQEVESDSGSEELDITDLVNSQKSMESKQNEYFEMMFKQLEGLQGKLSEMEGLVDKLNSIEEKVEKYRPKTPQEKLELRSLDSGPFHQKLTDFFDDKQDDLEKSGKNEYVLTSDEVEQIIPSDIKKSFDTALPEPTDTRFGMR